MLRAVGDAYVRLGYAVNRRAVRTTMAVALINTVVWWLISRDLTAALMISAAAAFSYTLVRRSKYGRRQFAQWAEEHPYPSA